MIGRTVSHYKILEKLGEGGMGVVYKAEDMTLGRTVALKFLPPELTRDAAAKERFIQEARAASALDHPNICNIHEVGETDDDQTFIAMAYYEGEDLKRRIERGPLKIDDAVAIASQIAQGLAKAHGQGIVHRDIKPANILITNDGLVKIVDFGLAKLAGTKLTKTGSTLGTAQYMSPEQIRGEDPDFRTDIWSLGVVFYEMLTGLPPFKGEYEQALTYQIMDAAPEPVTSLRTGIPVDLERIVNKCLERNRDERYQTAADLIADLRHAQRIMGARTGATPRPMLHAAAPVRRRRWLYWVVPGAAIVAVAAILLVRMPPNTPPAEEKSIAVLPFVDMSPQHDQEYFCDGMTEELIDRLGNIQGLRVPARTSAFFFKGKTGDVSEIGSKLHVQKVLEGSVRKAGDRLRVTAQLINVADGYHMWSQTYDRELKDVFAIQDEISAAIVSALELHLTATETRRLSEHPIDNVKAYECYLRANRQIYRFDEKSLDSAFVNLRTAIDIMGDNALLYAGMAEAYSQYANIGMGQEEYLEQAKIYAKKALTLDPDLPGALNELGVLAIYDEYPGNLEDEIRYSRKALAANPLDTDALRSMAVAYATLGKPAQGLAYADLFERQDPLNPWRFVLKGICYQYDCRFGPALEQFRAFHEADSTSPLGLTFYSLALASTGRRDEAIAVIDRAGSGNARNVEMAFGLLLKDALLKDKENVVRVMTPEFQKTCRRDFEWSYYVAARLSLLGATQEALDWLDNAVSRGFINYPYIQCDPFLDNIRGEERFGKLLERAKYEWEHFEVPE